ncbi:hypothetical protein CVT25_010784 [Psilocybe cyanescens]|uniref:Uncharacterized protein n=1 Tax=Psilocybe cyanescens TaxID=93625 RepID=A0A409XWM5_PSICY|nr:hypothetical protein CVT25_010784 [Psilocybe cyanescens]
MFVTDIMLMFNTVPLKVAFVVWGLHSEPPICTLSPWLALLWLAQGFVPLVTARICKTRVHEGLLYAREKQEGDRDEPRTTSIL